MVAHCYVICRPDAPVPEGEGVNGTAIELHPDGPVAVLLSVVPHIGACADRKALVAHANVVEQAFHDGVVLPLRFPTVLGSPAEAVTRLIRPRRTTLHRALDRLDGREEVRVRLTYDQDAAVAEVLLENPRLASLRNKPRASFQLGEGIVEALRVKAARDADAALAALHDVVVDVQVDRAGGERDVLTASVLVASGATTRAKETLESWAATRLPLRLRVAGPLPPYSFAHIDTRD